MRFLLLFLLCLPATAADKLNWDNDADVLKWIGRAGGELIAANATTPRETLVAQLRRAHCRLDLPTFRTGLREPSEIYNRTRPSVIAIAGLYRCAKCNDWHVSLSSGFIITRNGVAATNCHVFKSPEPKAFVALTRDGELFPVTEILAANEADDVAIIQIASRGKTLAALPLAGIDEAVVADETLAPIGSRISVISHPEHHFYMFTDGIISRYLDWRQPSNTVRRVTITADFAGGSSGAPVLNTRGEAVAIVCATHTVFSTKIKDKPEPQMTLKLCVPINRLRALFTP